VGELPAGVVTFLLTDIEGSTALWDTNPDAMSHALNQHERLVTEVVAENRGRTIRERGEGDSTLSVFPRATDAVHAAIALQLALNEEPWSGGLELPTRMALHTGEAQLRDGDYYGGTLNRAARIRSLASGGQVLCSRATHDLVADVLSDDVDLVEVGTRDLKGLQRGETIYALSHPQLAPVSSLPPALPTVPSKPPSGVLVGRARELAGLRQALDAAVTGRGTVALISGEPGIGKTSLAEHVGAIAAERGARVLWGRCFEGVGAPAYWPVLQILRAYVERLPPATLRAELGTDAAELARLLPELREPLPGVEAPAADDEGARFRLFDAVYRFLGRVASKQPLVLVFDDLHSADRSTVLLLEFAARMLASVPVLVIGTYRDVEIDADHPLRVTLGELVRASGAVSIQLTGLPVADIATFVAQLTDADPDERLVAVLAARTEGNPFFVGELVRLLASEDSIDSTAVERRLPETVRAAVARRLDRLGSDLRELLAVSAVIGRDFDGSTLQFAAEHATADIGDLLDRAIDAYVIEKTGHDAYRFVHALVRDTLIDDLSENSRIRMHRRVAEALEQGHSTDLDDHLDEIALHMFASAQAGRADHALAYSARAARRAESLFAHETAAEHYQRALTLSELQPSFPVSERVDLLLELGAVAWRSGDRERARASFQRAADLSRRVGDAECFARAAVGFAEGQWFRPSAGEYGDSAAVALLEEAAELTRTLDAPVRALLLACLAKETTFSKPLAERQVLVNEAVEIARRRGDLITLGLVRGHAWTATWTPDNLDERAAIADEIAAIAHQTGNEPLAGSAATMRVAVRLESGNADRFGEILNEGVMLAERLRIPATLHLVRAHQTMWHTARGEFAKAERTLEDGFEIGRQASPVALTVMRGAIAMLAYHRGQLDELLPLVAEAAEGSPSLVFPAAQALWLAQAGHEREARAMVDRLITDPGLERWPRTWMWLFEFTMISETISLVGPDQLIAVCYEMLLPFQSRQIALAWAANNHGSVAYVLGRLARQLGRLEDAETHYAAAIEQNRQFGFKPHVARSQAALANLLAERGGTRDRDRAISFLNASRAAADELGLGLILAECHHVEAILNARSERSHEN
jgi:class 3 adenylate cyclase/tetratricopeptide (TPR) repeat protein